MSAPSFTWENYAFGLSLLIGERHCDAAMRHDISSSEKRTHHRSTLTLPKTAPHPPPDMICPLLTSHKLLWILFSKKKKSGPWRAPHMAQMTALTRTADSPHAKKIKIKKHVKSWNAFPDERHPNVTAPRGSAHPTRTDTCAVVSQAGA